MVWSSQLKVKIPHRGSGLTSVCNRVPVPNVPVGRRDPGGFEASGPPQKQSTETFLSFILVFRKGNYE